MLVTSGLASPGNGIFVFKKSFKELGKEIHTWLVLISSKLGQPELAKKKSINILKE